MIKECCENCYACKVCDIHNEDEDLEITYCIGFMPKEELVRADERNNIRELILDSNFYIDDDNGKTYEVLVNELKPKMIDEFEESIRQDERNKILNLLKEDLIDYKKLREENKDNKNLAIEDTALIVYINSLIYEIERGNNE